MNKSALQAMQKYLADLARHLSAKDIEVWLEEHTAKHAELSNYKAISLKNIGK